MESTDIDYKEKLSYLEMKLWQKKNWEIPITDEAIIKCEWLLELSKLRKREVQAEIAQLEKGIEEKQKGQLK